MNWLTRSLFCCAVLLPSPAVMGQIKVFTCEPEWAALTQQLGADKVEVYSATNGKQDPHHIQARPSLIARIRNTDLVVCTGAELEVGWLPMLMRRARNPEVLPGKPGYFEATDTVQLMEIPQHLDRAEGDVHAEGNPHIQLDPRRIHQVAEVLAKRLIQLDPTHESDYLQNWEDFDRRWREAMDIWGRKAEPLAGKSAVVYHSEWLYLLDWLSIHKMGSLEPNPGIPPTLSQLTHLRDLGRADLIIISPLNDPKPANWLHEQNGTPIVVLPQTLGATEDISDLFTLFDFIIDRLLTALE